MIHTVSATFLMALRRFRRSKGRQAAAALSYTSLLALVPLLAIGFIVFTAFPAFNDIQEQLQTAIFQNFAPHAGAAVEEQFASFLANTSKLSGIGVVAMIATAIMLLLVIEGTFNTFWRVPPSRPLMIRLLSFWAMITLGPLLIGMSMTLSVSFLAVAEDTAGGGLLSFFKPLKFLIPLLLEWGAFGFLYLALPHTKVVFRHAAIGGLFAAILFELLKTGFGVYLAANQSYNAIYGALATIPIFLIWMYLTWSVILLGAALTATLPLAERHRTRTKEEK